MSRGPIVTSLQDAASHQFRGMRALAQELLLGRSMIRRARVAGLGMLVATGAAMALAPSDARACGGCFPPPGEQQSVVTDHRMVLSVSPQQTTLYDEIEYSGSPSSFAWVLPISGTVDVGLSADTLFGTLQNLTATVVQAPPDRCPPPPDCGYESDSTSPKGGSSSSSSGSSGTLEEPPVDVLKQETVGPYSTVQLRSTDANALTKWLTDNGFAIPADIQPVIQQYVTEHFDFLALKLVPGAGVQAMRPVRVTSVGASAVLPLRMVAAGTGAVVGISLWVIAEGRYEPQSFPFFTIKSEDLLWDWATATSNYKGLRAAKTAASGGRAWEIESAIAMDRGSFGNSVTNLGLQSPSPGSDYTPIVTDGVTQKTADEARQADLETLFKGIPAGQEHVTRIRSDLAHTALTADLLLVASADQSVLSNIRQPTHEQGQPLCAIYSGCDQVGTAPRDEAIARSDAAGNQESFACAATSRKHPHGGAEAVAASGLLALFALSFFRARRARGSRKS